jgi:hypothetical protein
MSGRRSRQKGSRVELAIVHALQEHGFVAEKTSRTGYAGSDLSMSLLGVDRRVEVKCRGTGFRQLYKWLTDADLLIIKSDRAEPLVVIPITLAIEIAVAAAKRFAQANGGPRRLVRENSNSKRNIRCREPTSN